MILKNSDKTFVESKIETTIENLQITITPHNIHIKDSYIIMYPFEMRNILEKLKKLLEESGITMDTPFNHRSICSMIREWIAHNNAYVLGYKKERTGNVDLNYSQKWYVKVLYFMLSLVIL